jgi:hypothetical protein
MAYLEIPASRTALVARELRAVPDTPTKNGDRRHLVVGVRCGRSCAKVKTVNYDVS